MLATAPGSHSIRDSIRAELANLLGPLISGKKDISMTNQLPYYNGPDSIFGSLNGVNQDFISLIAQPTGLASQIPAYPTVYATPEFGYITGFGGLVGTRADGVCDDARQAGPIYTCIQTAHFGRYRMDTRPVEINHVGLMRNYNDPTSLRVINGPLMSNLGGMQPQSAFNSGEVFFNPEDEMMSRMAEAAREMGNILMDQFWHGDPANVTTNGGEDEFPGLDMLISTTKLDARSGIPCEGLRSDIKPFNGANITSDGGQAIYTVMSNIVYTRRFVARRTNMGEVTWVWVMRENAFHELSKIWPCVYATTGCLVTDSFSMNVNAVDQIRDRDAMRNGRYIDIDGTRFQVVFDDAIPETSTGDGCFTSDMYFIPLRVLGNVAVLYWEYLDYTKGAMVAASQGKYTPGTFWTDAGRYLWWNKPNTNVCIQLGMKTEPRIIFLTPHLAGRITDVEYCALQHPIDTFSGQPYYPTLLGSQVRTRTGLYSEWNPTTPGF